MFFSANVAADASGLLRAIGERPTDLLRIEARQDCGRSASAENISQTTAAVTCRR